MFPSQHDLHTTLWSSFIGRTEADRFPADRRPLSLEATLETLLALLKPENLKVLRSMPRSLLGLATWNLLPYYLRTPDRKKLEPLLLNVIGMTIDQVETIYERSKDPLLVLARQYNILDYRWEMKTSGENEHEAQIQLAVQVELGSMKHVVFPDHWTKFDWLWGGIDLVARRNEPTWRRKDAGEEQCRGRVKLPGGPRETEVHVDLDVSFQSTSVEVKNDFVLRGDLFESCDGTFSIQKMRGRPGATHVTHRKKVLFKPFVPAQIQSSLLSYWVQSETLRLVLPD